MARRLVSTGEYRAAGDLLGTLDKATLSDPAGFAEACELMAMLDAPEETLAWLDAAERAGARGAMFSYLRGNSCKHIGDFDGARAAYLDAIGQSPSDGFFHLALATLGGESEPGRIDELRKLSTVAGTSPEAIEQRVAFGFALFRELDRIDDVDAAWSALSTAMTTKRQTIRYERDADERVFARLLEAFGTRMPTAEAMESSQNGRTPIFILGMPRSGTTLVERMLGNHSKVTACGEISELRMSYKWAVDYYSPGIVDEIAASRAGRIDISAFGKIYLDATQWRSETRWFTDKHPGNLALASVILHSLPDARIVYVRRNPMDTCFSNLKELYRHGYYEYSYEFGDLAAYCRNSRRYMYELKKHDHHGRILEIDYEELVRSPGMAARVMQEHCGLPEEAGLEDVARNRSAVTTASSVQVRRPVHTASIGGWHRYERHLEKLRTALTDLE